jgi:hypothetical protein
MKSIFKEFHSMLVFHLPKEEVGEASENSALLFYHNFRVFLVSKIIDLSRELQFNVGLYCFEQRLVFISWNILPDDARFSFLRR